MTRRPANRPTKFTSDTVDRLLDGIRKGLPIHLACSAAGIDDSRYYEWQNGKFPRGADPELKRKFRDELTRARDEAAYRSITLINDAATEDWKAAAWILERRYPKEFGRQSLEITGSEGGPIQVEAATMQRVILKALDAYPEARVEVAAALLEAKNGDGGK